MLSTKILASDFYAFFGRVLSVPGFDKNYGRHELGKNPAVPGWRVGVLIDKEATVVARASVNHEGLNGLVEAKRFKAAAVQRRAA